MTLPTTQELDQISYLIGQCKFHDILSPEKREMMMKMALHAQTNDMLDSIAGQIAAMRDDMDKQNSALLGRLESMEQDTTAISEWFQASRTFDGVGELIVALERVKP